MRYRMKTNTQSRHETKYKYILLYINTYTVTFDTIWTNKKAENYLISSKKESKV